MGARAGSSATAPHNLQSRVRANAAPWTAGVDLVLGLNGWVWVSPHMARGEDGGPLYDPEVGPLPPTLEQRQATCR